MEHLKKGLAGESKACDYLIEKGYGIVERNYRSGKGEIDIIAFKDICYYFIEVKYRKNNRYGYPEDFVNKKKFQMVQQTAEAYILQHDWHGRIRFDVIAITGEEEPVHMEDITL
ncbi:MAG: YraN family protein [Cytophagales bacterium]|nr:YraN family protein [Cytophaga sp.]